MAEELDEITGRIKNLTNSLKLVGVYDASAEGIGTMLQSSDNTMIPVSNMSALAGKGVQAGGGLEGVVKFLPIRDVAEALGGLYAARDQVKAVLFEVSGVSDIVRGQVDPREKASQSKIKAEFAGQRLDQRRRQVERCARDVARIQAELMIELYPPDRLREQSGFDFINEVQQLDEGGREQAWQSVMQLLQNEKMRGFRLDVETDSTVELNAQAQQDSRVEFLTAAGSSFLQNALPVMQASPEMVPVMGEMLLFAVRSFRSGRTLESKFEETVDALAHEGQTAAAGRAAGGRAGPAAGGSGGAGGAGGSSGHAGRDASQAG